MTGYLPFSPHSLKETVAALRPDRVLAIIDQRVEATCRDLLSPLFDLVEPIDCLSLSAGEEIKELSKVDDLAYWLNDRKATRKSLLLAVGGGSLLDFCGFLGAIYKRGLHVVYIPTTLLAMVDAAFGGKTAVNAASVKNLIGLFCEPLGVLLGLEFLKRLPERELISGYCEVVKYGLLESEEFTYTTLSFAPLSPTADFLGVIERSIAVKAKYVEGDFYDNGLRRCLNLGHTVGHAFEGYSHTRENGGDRALRHGEAICFGIIVELYLSQQMLGFPTSVIRAISNYAKEYISPFVFGCKEYGEIIKLMYQDKKNRSNHISIIGLRRPGEPVEIEVSEALIKAGLDFYRETFGQ